MSPKPIAMALKRRSFAEQRVVRLLRLFAENRSTGATLDAEIVGLGFAPAAVRRFGPLVKLAVTVGYEFQSSRSPFAASGELGLVGLLACAQRVHVYPPIAVDCEFRDMLIACGAALDTIGIRLPALAMVSAQLSKR